MISYKKIKETILLSALLPVIAFALWDNPAHGQSLLNSDSNEPIEITADETLEWLRNSNKFIAKKNAKAVQGQTSITANTLEAHYISTNQKNMDIQKLIATDHVEIISKTNSAYGQKAIYDIQKGLAIMTGDNLLLRGPDQEITARDKFEYWTTDGKLVATGKSKIKRKNKTGQYDTLAAEKIIAYMQENQKGERVLKSLEAIDNVKITTPTETITGQRGIYRANPNMAEIIGNVKIKRGPNILEGERAEVDLTTNTSKIFGAKNNNGRVRGVFYPGSEKLDKTR